MDVLRELLEDNNILLHAEAEEKEYHYYNVVVRKKSNLYLIDKDQPLVQKIGCKFNLVDNDYVLSEYHYLYFAELIKLEQGNVTFS